MRISFSEQASHCYQMALDLSVKISMFNSTEIEALRQRFISEAHRIGSEESDPLVWRMFSQICEVYLNEALDYERSRERGVGR
jgi:hypothetical protein